MGMLTGLKEKLSFSANQKTFAIIVVCLIFIGISVYVYKYYVEPRLKPKYVPNKEFEGGETATAEIMYFFTEWCPHCKKAKTHWENFKQEFDGKTINNYKIICKEYDCEKNDKVCDEFKVEGYPTIKMLKDGQTIDFDAKPTIENLTSFVESTL